MTAKEHQSHVDELVARRQALRAAGAAHQALEQNRLELVFAIAARNRSLIAAHLVAA